MSLSMLIRIWALHSPPGRGTDLERGYGDVRPWRPPFHASPTARKGPISNNRVSSQDPLLRKFGNSPSTASIFTQILAHKHPNLEIFSSQAPKFGNFQLTSPQIWKCSAHKPPFQMQMSVRKHRTSEIRAAHLYLKKVECHPPPPGIVLYDQTMHPILTPKSLCLLLVVIDKVFTIGGPGYGKSTLLFYCQIALMHGGPPVAEK